jgi:hypothetical protein
MPKHPPKPPAAKSDGARYFNKTGSVPRTVPAGRALAHNHIAHTINMGHGHQRLPLWDVASGQGAAQFQAVHHFAAFAEVIDGSGYRGQSPNRPPASGSFALCRAFQGTR